jgi:acyl carrier protein
VTTLTRDEFRRYVAAEVELDPESIPFDATLRDQVGLDSIQMFLLLIAIEDLGVWFPEEMLAQVITLDDAYYHYVTHSQAPV